MKRRAFLELAGTVPLLGIATQSAREIALPVELRGGRFFAVPKLNDGRDFVCWLDTDGSGFIFDESVKRFALPARSDGSRAFARLPSFSPQRGVPPVVRDGGELPVFAKNAAGSDPILRGFDAQLGGSWFADRIWHFDFRQPSMTLGLTPLGAGEANVPLTFDRVYPQIVANVAGESLPMSFDIAASLALATSDELGMRVVATSFVTRAQFERWHAAHPEWRVDRNVSTQSGIDRILVPEVTAGGVTFPGVEFTTRPDDDVFEGGRLAGKLGSNAYANRIVTIDYPNARLRVE
jgi:hypothetical protein